MSDRLRVRWFSSRVRWYEFAPEVLLAAGLSFFAVTEPHAAVAGLKTSKTITLIVVVVLGWGVARAVSAVAVRWPFVRLALFGVAALAILKVVVLPAYDDKTVVETLSRVTPASAPVAVESSDPVLDPIKIRTGRLQGIDHR